MSRRGHPRRWTAHRAARLLPCPAHGQGRAQGGLAVVSTRREILRRGGVLAGALLLGAAPGATAIGGTRARGTRGAPGRSGLDDARRGAFAALAAVALTDPAL